MPLVRAVYHDLLRRVAVHSNQGRNDGGQGAQFPRRQKVLTMSQVLQCSTFASETPQVRTWGAKLASCPGRHLTSLHP